jgi:hypothetical protein
MVLSFRVLGENTTLYGERIEKELDMEATELNIENEFPRTDRKNLIQTTLYDLIEALNEEVTPEDDKLINAVILDLVGSGRIRWRRDLDRHLNRWDRQEFDDTYSNKCAA